MLNWPAIAADEGPPHRGDRDDWSSHSNRGCYWAGVPASLYLDGVNDFVNIEHAPELNLTQGGEFTAEAWIRHQLPNDASCHRIVAKGSYRVDLCDGRLAVFAESRGPQIPENVWTHIAVTWQSGGAQRYYINGQDVGSRTAATPSDNTDASQLRVGGRVFNPQGDLTEAYRGNISELRLWNVARSQDDLRHTMHTAIEERLPGLVAAWHFDESSSGNVEDVIGGHTGFLFHEASLSGPPAPPEYATAAIEASFGELLNRRDHPTVAYIPRLNRALVIGGERGVGQFGSTIEAVDVGSGHSETVGLGMSVTRATAAYVSDPVVDKAYLFGGVVAGFRSDGIFAIDPELSDGDTLLTAVAQLPEAISDAASVYHPLTEKVYVLGGQTAVGLTDAISVFDPRSETVQAIGQTLPSRRAAAAAVVSSATGSMYLFGGRVQVEGNPFNDNQIVEVQIDTDDPSGTSLTIAPLGSLRLPHGTSFQSALEESNQQANLSDRRAKTSSARGGYLIR